MWASGRSLVGAGGGNCVAAMKRDVRILLLGEGRRRAGEPGGGLGAAGVGPEWGGARPSWPMR